MKYIIEARNPMPYAIRRKDGYELWANNREMYYILNNISAFNPYNNSQISRCNASCFILEGNSWVKGNNGISVNSIEEFVQRLQASPSFTKAISEFKEQNMGI